MIEYLNEIVIFAIVGAGVVTGLLFAFSNFVMRALADLPAEHGMFAMQRINEKILNPIFFVLFFGTPLLCAVTVFSVFDTLNEPGYVMLFWGAVAYLVGPFGITLMFNVPLNNKLAATPRVGAEVEWPDYRQKWQRWNHIRTYIGILSIFFLAAGLSYV